jgi:hypothetical protein
VVKRSPLIIYAQVPISIRVGFLRELKTLVASLLS